MIGHQQKNRKQERTAKLGGVHAAKPVTKKNVTDGSDMTINPELDKFSGDEYLPEKHKEAEILLAKSILPPFK